MVTMRDVRQGGKEAARIFDSTGRQGPHYEGVLVISGFLMPQDGAELSQNALSGKAIEPDHQLIVCKATGVCDVGKWFTGQRDVGLKDPRRSFFLVGEFFHGKCFYPSCAIKSSQAFM